MTAAELPDADLVMLRHAAEENIRRGYPREPLASNQTTLYLLDSLAALADTVPASTLGTVATSYDEKLRKARAERDALAAVIEQAKAAAQRAQTVDGVTDKGWLSPDEWRLEQIDIALATAPADALDRHNTEIKATTIDELAQQWAELPSSQRPRPWLIGDWLRARANTIRSGMR